MAASAEAADLIRAALLSDPPGRPIYNSCLHYVHGKVSASAALDPRFRLMPLMFREQEVADWKTWVQGGNQTARLLTGEGGMGKTRLMLEVCAAVSPLGWRAGFLKVNVDRDALRRQMAVPGNLLVVVDYAERRATDVRTLCELVMELAATDRVRIALLARRSDAEWLNRLRDGGPTRHLLDEDKLSRRELSPAASTEEQRWAVIDAAVRAFALSAGVTEVERLLRTLRERINIHLGEYNSVLDLILEAWAAVFGDASASSPMDEVIKWERRYLRDLAPDPLTPDTMMEVLAWIFDKGGAPTRREAVSALTSCPSLTGLSTPMVAKVAEVFHNCYWGPDWLNAIQPDRVGEEIARRYKV